MKTAFIIFAAAWVCFLSLAYAKEETSAAPAELKATASLQDAQGRKLGEVTVKETPQGVLLNVKLKNVPAGVHAFHVHQKGICTPPDFASAGGHFNPGNRKHGLMAMEGSHGGDMPNIHVASKDEMNVEILARGLTLKKGSVNSLFDEDGSALVLHETADDYLSDPAGNAGTRLACGVVQLP